jgi:ABC-type lipoprotein release transport system permease subunit
MVGSYIIRSSSDAPSLLPGLIHVGQALPTRVELTALESVESELLRSTAPKRVMMWLLLSLGGLGLLLSALGVYAVLAFAVTCRAREIGIRMALGATPTQVRGLFMRRGFRLIVNGLAVGLAAAITAGNYIQSLLFGVAPTDPWSLTAVSLILLAVGGVACWIPARRAAQGSAMEALRCE